MNGYFDSRNPDKVVHRGEYLEYFDDMETIAGLPNSRKFVLNFWDENLMNEFARAKIRFERSNAEKRNRKMHTLENNKLKKGVAS